MRIYLWNQTWPLIGPSPTQTLFKGCHSTPTIKISRIGCWEPPEDGSFKLNVDRTLFFDLQEARVDFILNDNKGDVIMAASMLEKAVLTPKLNYRKFGHLLSSTLLYAHGESLALLLNRIARWWLTNCCNLRIHSLH